MSLAIVDGDSSGTIGATFRRLRQGPEAALVESFLRAMPLDIPSGCRATVFREPRLESGFPDLVIVVWRVATAQAWTAERAALEPRDLRLVHYLHQMRWASITELEQHFGRRVLGSLERLEQADTIRRAGNSWTPRALSASFAATKIIAVEAKVGRWSDALAQAILNTWFASKSYVLVPQAPSPDLVVAAQRFGVGICSLDNESVREIEIRNGSLPRSYASWLLNEWAWQAWKAKGSQE